MLLNKIYGLEELLRNSHNDILFQDFARQLLFIFFYIDNKSYFYSLVIIIHYTYIIDDIKLKYTSQININKTYLKPCNKIGSLDRII